MQSFAFKGTNDFAPLIYENRTLKLAQIRLARCKENYSDQLARYQESKSKFVSAWFYFHFLVSVRLENLYPNEKIFLLNEANALLEKRKMLLKHGKEELANKRYQILVQF